MTNLGEELRDEEVEEMTREAGAGGDSRTNRDGNGFTSAAESRHVMANLGKQLADGKVDETIHRAGRRARLGMDALPRSR